MNTFIEITKSEHGHGGEGWEFGTCLWSPARNRAGNDRYSIMRMPEPGDRIIHFYETQHDERLDTYIIGESRVRRKMGEVGVEPPSPGNWAGMAPYYRIALSNYRQYESPLPIRQFVQEYSGEIRADLLQTRPVFYPFNTHGEGVRTVQGIYLAKATETLTQLIDQALGIESAEEAEAGKGDIRNTPNPAERLVKGISSLAIQSSLGLRRNERNTVAKRAGFTFQIVMGKSEKISWRPITWMLWRIAQSLNGRTTCGHRLIALSLSARTATECCTGEGPPTRRNSYARCFVKVNCSRIKAFRPN